MIAVAVVGLGISAVSAQNPAADRQALMKANGKSVYGDISRMVKGDIPYSQAMVDAAITQLENDTKRIGALYAASPKQSAQGNFKGADKIWETPADFNAKIEALAKAVAGVKGTIKDVDTLRPAAAAINGGCNGCHEVFRQRAS
jgi:cytochrome c556